jgi:hypothetical protein
MTNGHGNETAANKIATAQANLCLALRLMDDVEQGRITAEIFKRRVTVRSDGDSVELSPSPEKNDDNLKDEIFNIVLNALSVSALVVDETLDEAFGPPAKDTDPSRIGIRFMVNQLRNAFAHNPWRPKWKIFSQKARKSYPIELDDGTKITFDATNLHGDGRKAEQVGGLGFWMKLLRHCEGLVG